MTERRPGTILYYAAAALLVLTCLSLFLEYNAALDWLQAVGWLPVGVGVVLFFPPISVLSRKGRPADGNTWTHTSILEDAGVYAVMRHPLYLGWALMYPAHALASQH